MKTISIVTPVYDEEPNLRDCYAAVRLIFDRELAGYRREHLFCDNASRDDTLSILREIAAADPLVKIIVNTRDFGPLRNTFNGVMATSGDAVLLFLPADLQDPPELLPKFVALWEQGYEIVYGIRASREERWPMRGVRNAYYRLLSRFSEFKVPPGVGDFQLVDRRVVEAMRQIDDTHPFMRLMTFECGGRAVGVPYTWRARKKGHSKNRILGLVDQGMNGITSFTWAPVRIGLIAGFVISFLSIAYAVADLVLALLVERRLAQPGIMTLIVAIFFFGGVQLLFLGFVGEYVLAMHNQLRKRPVVFERERINFSRPAETTSQETHIAPLA